MLFLSVLFALCSSLAPTDEKPWHELTLANGIEVIIFEAPLAEQQAFFTLIPLGLLDDEAESAQFSHLMEHLILRSTDPDSLITDDMLINGETTGLTLRLESFGDPENWETSFARHVAWLAADEVDGEVLAREKASIESEEQNTSARGATHKWALAAWNQIVRHGTSHVGVHGDVANVSVEDARRYLTRRLRSGPGALFVAVGPLSVDEISEKIRVGLEALPGVPWAVSAPSVEKEAILAQQDRVATWDVDARHYMEWYPVPSQTPLDRVLADALAMLINVKIQQLASLRQKGVTALAQADLVTPEGRWLLISASLPPGMPVADLQADLGEIIESTRSGQEAALVVRQLRMQLTEDADFAAIRESLGNERARWIEAQQMIFMLYAQLNMGLSRGELVAAYEDLDAASMLSFSDMVLTNSRRSTLLIEPAL
ncbi:MAG: hypothetical protein P8N09_01480 [Planctomycetota bacterium]|nr:hypothetical protein [Planctomycetota bacterium]